jgi:hypothetical protein
MLILIDTESREIVEMAEPTESPDDLMFDALKCGAPTPGDLAEAEQVLVEAGA